MASLSSILVSRYTKTAATTVLPTEQNIEKGKVYTFVEGSSRAKFFTGGFCWCAPASGTAIIEVWGAGGSASKMCCCGHGLPGNSGAYSKKTIQVTAGSWVCGQNGWSCANDTLCYRGCSEPTTVCWCIGSGGGQSGCICAQGGMGGLAICSTTPSMVCCYCANGFCVTNTGTNCGIICNWAGPGNSSFNWMACGFGGDVNCCGQFNKVDQRGCLPSCPCQRAQEIYVPPGFISTGGSYVKFNGITGDAQSNWSGQGLSPLLHGINFASKNPTMGGHHAACWAGKLSCGCYEDHQCQFWLPIGVGSPAVAPCDNVRDHGMRGGQGAVRIKFYS
jgi:hypothetical protein